MITNINSVSTAAKHQLHVARPPHCLETDISARVCEFLGPKDIGRFLVANNSYKGRDVNGRKDHLNWHISRHFDTSQALSTTREMRIYERSLGLKFQVTRPVVMRHIDPTSTEARNVFSEWIKSEFPQLRFTAEPETMTLTYLDYPPYHESDDLIPNTVNFIITCFHKTTTISLYVQSSETTPPKEVAWSNGLCTFPVFSLAPILHIRRRLSPGELKASLETCFTKIRPNHWLSYADSLIQHGAVANLSRILQRIMNAHLFSHADRATDFLNWWLKKEAEASLLKTSPQVIENMLASVSSLLNPDLAAIEAGTSAQHSSEQFDSKVAVVLREIVKAGGQITSLCLTKHAIELLFPKTLEILLDCYSKRKNMASEQTTSEITAFLNGSDRSASRSWVFTKIITSVASRLTRELVTANMYGRQALTAVDIWNTLVPQILEILRHLHNHGAFLNKNDRHVAKLLKKVIPDKDPDYDHALLIGLPKRVRTEEQAQQVQQLHKAICKYAFSQIDALLTELSTPRPATTAAATLPPKE
jgi:hypothetical protein